MKPKFSIVIPVLNGEMTIEKCLDSIVAQTFQDYELIIIDNNSIDSTKIICQKFKTASYHFCENKGRSIARNLGTKIASGTYIVFIDCDVIIEKTWLQSVSYFLENTPVDILATAILPFKEDNKNIVDKYRHFFGEYKSHGTFLSLHKFFGVMPVINTAACVCLRKSLLECGGFNESLKRNEDLDLSLKMFSKGFVLGGTAKAQSMVRFITKYRTLGYLQRNYDRTSNSIISNTPFTMVFFKLLKKSILEKENRLSFYLFSLEISNLLGFISSATNFSIKKINIEARKQWNFSPTKKTFRFSFMFENKFCSISPTSYLIFIDEEVYNTNTMFKSTRLSHDIARACQKLLKAEILGQKEKEQLIQSELFIYAK